MLAGCRPWQPFSGSAPGTHPRQASAALTGSRSQLSAAAGASERRAYSSLRASSSMGLHSSQLHSRQLHSALLLSQMMRLAAAAGVPESRAPCDLRRHHPWLHGRHPQCAMGHGWLMWLPAASWTRREPSAAACCCQRRLRECRLRGLSRPAPGRSREILQGPGLSAMAGASAASHRLCCLPESWPCYPAWKQSCSRPFWVSLATHAQSASEPNHTAAGHGRLLNKDGYPCMVTMPRSGTCTGQRHT